MYNRLVMSILEPPIYEHEDHYYDIGRHREPGRVSRLFLWMACVAIIVSYIGYTMFDVPVIDKVAARAIVQGTFAVLSGFTAIWLFVFRVKGKERMIWVFLTLGILFWNVGDSYNSFILGQLAPSTVRPSLADLCYVVSYLLLFGMVMRVGGALDVTKGSEPHKRLVPKWLALFLTVSILTWFIFLNPLYAQAESVPLIQKLFDSLYPIFDIAIVTGMLTVMSQIRVTKQPRWLNVLVVGLINYLIADLAYNYFSVSGSYSVQNFTANLLFSVWAAAYAFFFMAGIYRASSPELPEDLESHASIA